MDYCILVELSRKSIAFSYYTSDIDKFEPYGDELVKPLAVWFSGSSVIVGTDAKSEALKGTTNAFYDLFELMKRQEHFDYANEKHEYNKLILYTIKAGLREFFIKVMLNTKGTLDENIAKLPLLLTIGADVELNERNVLVNQLRDNGFGNVFEISEDRYIIHSFCKEEAVAAQLSLILSSNGDHIYGTVYKGEQLIDTFTYKNAGKDPRVDKLANLVWERTRAENDWLIFENEISELRNAAVKFIQSGDIERNDSITLSNGYEYSFYLTRDDLNLYNQSDGGHITQEIVSRAIQYGSKQDCLVVLKEEAATNRYLQELFTPEFPMLKILNKTNKAIVLGMIVKWCKDQTFLFPQPNRKLQTTAVSVESSKVKDVLTKRDERSFRMLIMSIETCLHNGDIKNAHHDAEEFLREMHEKNITVFDVQVEELLSRFSTADGVSKEVDIVDNRTLFNSESGKILNKNVESTTPSPRDNRNFKILQKSVDTSIKNGNVDKTMCEIKKFIQEMHERSIYTFDEAIEEMKIQLENLNLQIIADNGRSSNVQGNSRHVTVKPVLEKIIPNEKLPIENKADKLMQHGKFKEARELYRESGRLTQANDCTTLIKWTRLLAQYQSEIGATEQSHNVDKAKMRVQEIQAYIAIYKKYGIDITELLALQKEYKRIK